MYFHSGPGMNKTTTLSKKTKDLIGFVLIYPSNNFFGQREARCNVGRSCASCIANFLDLKNRSTQVQIMLLLN